jgi:hypothetical protein
MDANSNFVNCIFLVILIKFDDFFDGLFGDLSDNSSLAISLISSFKNLYFVFPLSTNTLLLNALS